jgi:SAM-dependent methyltransferase
MIYAQDAFTQKIMERRSELVLRSEQTDLPGPEMLIAQFKQPSDHEGVVSEVFDPTSEAFVSETVRNRPGLALDLGCGPGFTTRLLSRIARPERTVGVDRSEAFLS